MLTINQTHNKLFSLKALFEDTPFKKIYIQEKFQITFFTSEKTAYIYLGQKQTFHAQQLLLAIKKILQQNHFGFNLHLSTFLTRNLKLQQIIKMFVAQYYEHNVVAYNQKAKPLSHVQKQALNLLDLNNKENKACFEEALMYSQIALWVRKHQMLPPNQLNAVNFATEIANQFQQFKQLDVTIYDQAALQKLKMGLLLAVNQGSSHEARLVTINYRGNKKTTAQHALIGKGVMYDSGGYTLKPETALEGMKFDMSGAAIVAGAMLAIAHTKPKINVVAVLPLTDNMLGSRAIVPDMVFRAMNGKSVEINDTDAEGRLILADAISFALTKMAATTLTTVATLTGAVQTALSTFHTGVWATDDLVWKQFQQTAQKEMEPVWRLPFATGFLAKLTNSPVADIKNYDTSKGGGGATSAATFLRYFTNDRPFIHCDIAATAATNGQANAPLIKTLAQFWK